MHQFSHQFDKLADILNGAHNVLLLNPERGDGDSLGSTLALAHHLKRKRKQHTVFSHNLAPKTYSYLPRIEHIVRHRDDLDFGAFDVIVGIDYADSKMTGIHDLLENRSDSTKLVIIDHHQTSETSGDLNIIHPQSAAAAEIVFALFDHHRWPIDRAVATCLLTGVLTDSGIFSNRNTTDTTLAIAARLLTAGADMNTITHSTMRNKSTATLRLWGTAFSRLQLNPATGLVTTFITDADMRETGADDDAASGIANFLNMLDGAKAVLVLRESGDGRVKGSFRTTGDEVDVAQLAAQFGGGGHRRAAGFVVPGKIECVNGVWKVV